MKFISILSNCAVQRVLLGAAGVACLILGCLPVLAPQQMGLWAFGAYLIGKAQQAPGHGGI
jgi:hypothetical protein